MLYQTFSKEFIRGLCTALEERSIVLKGRKRTISQDESTDQLFVLWGWVAIDKLCLWEAY